MTDPLVLFMPSGKRGRFPVGTPVLDAARAARRLCRERVRRARHLRALPGRGAGRQVRQARHHLLERPHLAPSVAKETRYADKRDLKPTAAACPARRRSRATSSSTFRRTCRSTRRSSARPPTDRVIERNPAIQLCYVEVEEPDMHKPLGDLDRLKEALETRLGLGSDLLVRPAPAAEGAEDPAQGRMEGHRGHPPRHGIRAPDASSRSGPACTTRPTASPAISARPPSPCISSSLLSGRMLASSGTSNPQIRFGEDLMSRVSYVMMNPDGREAMTKAVREAINELIGKVCAEAGVDRRRHPRRGVRRQPDHASPVSRHRPDRTRRRALRARGLRRACTTWASEHRPARSIAARASTCCPASPAMSAPTPPAPRLSEGPHRQDEMTLLVDVGTNAEIVLGNRDRLVAASSPTGPAFEGAEISCGQRAAPGAIERVRIDPETLEPQIQGDRLRPVVRRGRLRRSRRSRPASPASAAPASSRWWPRCILAGIITEDGVIDGALAARIAAHRRRTAAPSPTCCATANRGITDHPERRARHPARQGRALCRHQAADGQARHRRRSTGSASPAPSAPSSTRNTPWCSA